ncbi:Presenilins-associated rhomboid-like protein, mitochondrial [Neolecta irregularis DAH-3]|uniref:Presenilins-associated rhomboid-like protein, mitochondrial n=1 Tax=Neolecta irregularis (strain DAH-3) TaxID=1198029 RepID=A0A1U7LS34_NEOID|nr:Presenilins-associated rhomboid-like protein, mitochondrial [Neolecta irregularis DAH-3]|eukprot:OLL25454.1 Presenilins-associated rhomboid-like protein, mitochondrial [Neolecta irregularis DAH-3]
MLPSSIRRTWAFSLKLPVYSRKFFASNNPFLHQKAQRFFSFTAHRTATHKSLRETSRSFYSQKQSSALKILVKPTLFAIFISGSAWIVSAQFTDSQDTITQTPFGALSESHKTIAAIIAGNIFIFLLWKFPPMQAKVFDAFLLNPSQILLDRGGSAKSLFSLLGSAFNHQSSTHIFLNLYALWQFGPMLHDFTGRPNFLAFYVTAAMSSSWLSLAMALLQRPLPMPKSLGASGAIFGILGTVCILEPDLRISIIFLPFIVGKIKYFIGATGLLELFAMLGRGRIPMPRRISLDHAGHVGGLAAGLGYGFHIRNEAERKRKRLEKVRKERLVRFGTWW